MNASILLFLWRLLVHVYRSIAAATVHRNVAPELDHVEAPALLAAELPLPAPAAHPYRDQLIDAEDAEPPEDPAPATMPLAAEGTIPAPAPGLAPLEIGPDGWATGELVVRVPTKRRGYRWRGPGGRPMGALWHWTATAHGTALAMAKRCAEPAKPGERAAWVHFWIEHDGTIYQSGPLTAGAPHAGAPSSARLAVVDGELRKVSRKESSLSANHFLFGTEVVCVGEVRPVKKSPSGWVAAKRGDPDAVMMGWPFGKGGQRGPIVPAAEVEEAVDREGVRRLYQLFTKRQLEAIERLARAFRARFGWSDAALSWGHVDVDPTRKTDPGPIFQKVQLPAILARMSS